MDTNKFERALNGAEVLLERIHNKLGQTCAGEEWFKNRAREGIAAARAELAKMRDDIWIKDEDLPSEGFVATTKPLAPRV